jgi:lactoylglutathione lyase
MSDESMTGLLVNVDVGDLEKALEFYTTGLGLRLRRHLGPNVAELEGAPCPVFLIQHARGTIPIAGATTTREYGRHWTPVHLDFVVDDLEAAVARAQAAGAVGEGEIREFAWGRYRVMADPFGNGFCILQFEGEGYAEPE